jgi:ribosomal protein L32
MDNQQATLVELGWLAGIIDGEGYLGIQIEKNTHFVTPSMHICNTDEKIILRAKDILEKLGVTTYCRVQNKTYVPNHKVVYKIQVKRHSSMVKILENVGEFLTGNKYQRGKLLLEFCKSRLEKHSNGKSNPYSKRELEIIEEVIPLQRKGASETIRKIQLEKSEILKEQRKRVHKLTLQELCKCDNCGKTISDSPSRIKNHKHHFCSVVCRYEFQRNNPFTYQKFASGNQYTVKI